MPQLPWPDIGHLAKWSVSSFKFGFRPECLQDGDHDTFWQCVFSVSVSLLAESGQVSRICSSDGPQPHFITIEFPRKVPIQVCALYLCCKPNGGHQLSRVYQKISLFLSFPLDDSYTPAALSVRAGTGPGDMQEVRSVTIDKPDGWITFDVCAEPADDGDGL